ncbi:fimbrillin family protein, partial [Klebsiella pneumoniae]|uniref:fimbrillin family protein n=1 Tax=Klebsiella pneumoniae TaxID=573 RepID=UPI00194FB116
NSNLLRTSAGVTSGATGVLSFTGGENAFVHRNTKLTLTFEGKNALTQPFAYMTVQGQGLYSGGTADEDIYLYRPDETKYTWHGILSPLTAESPTPEQKKVTVTVTDYNGVSYTASLTCERKAGSHYNYTLTLQNNILMPVGEEIKGWENGESHTGSLT